MEARGDGVQKELDPGEMVPQRMKAPGRENGATFPQERIMNLAESFGSVEVLQANPI
jgi:hypothetical protein